VAFLPEDEAAALRAYLASHLTAPVALELRVRPPAGAPGSAGHECPTCDEARAVLAELAALSDKLALRVREVAPRSADAAVPDVEADEVPAIAIAGPAGGRARFLGLPLGLEFETLLRSLIDAARGSTDLQAVTRQALRGLSRDVHVRVFVTPHCPYCPRVARLAHQMALESPRVRADVIDAEQFPDLADRYEVRGVPKVVVNDTVEFVGAQPEARFLEHILRAGA
jgi:glutaredoxin-like protein